MVVYSTSGRTQVHSPDVSDLGADKVLQESCCMLLCGMICDWGVSFLFGCVDISSCVSMVKYPSDVSVNLSSCLCGL